MSVTYQEALVIFLKSEQDCVRAHQNMCAKFGIEEDKVNAKSLYGKLKRALLRAKTLKKSKNEIKYARFLTSAFKLPESRELKQEMEEEKRKENMERIKTIFDQNTKIRKLTNDVALLRERLKSINCAKLNQKIKRQAIRIRAQNILISKLRRELNEYKKKNQRTRSTQDDTVRLDMPENNETVVQIKQESEHF
ncbi:uncharacterized protein LOC123549244 [Mercenaria mercenaria]|uniref:uncharacterized protein LOC123549244 n=1 Tax=Mercenaria mercenaria TaxID=6596 RepID=UPI00234EE145|nr:uncharacterized protein LOC123549244 [Mercenaria mercenaria]